MERQFHKTERTYNIDQVQSKMGLYTYDKADFFVDHFDKTTAWVILNRRITVDNKVQEHAVVHPLCGESEIRNMLKNLVDNRICPKENIYMHDIDCATVYFYDHNRPSEKGYIDFCYVENILKEKVRRVYHLPKSCESSITRIVMPYRNTDSRTTEPFDGYGELNNSKGHGRGVILKRVFAPPLTLKKGYTMRKSESAMNIGMDLLYEMGEIKGKTF